MAWRNICWAFRRVFFLLFQINVMDLLTLFELGCIQGNIGNVLHAFDVSRTERHTGFFFIKHLFLRLMNDNGEVGVKYYDLVTTLIDYELMSFVSIFNLKGNGQQPRFPMIKNKEIFDEFWTSCDLILNIWFVFGFMTNLK